MSSEGSRGRGSLHAVQASYLRDLLVTRRVKDGWKSTFTAAVVSNRPKQDRQMPNQDYNCPPSHMVCTE